MKNERKIQKLREREKHIYICEEDVARMLIYSRGRRGTKNRVKDIVTIKARAHAATARCAITLIIHPDASAGRKALRSVTEEIVMPRQFTDE